MGKPISIGVASDTREFAQGVKTGVISPLEDAVKSLDDVERAGDKAGEELEGAFEKAQREVSDFKREQADAARDTSRSWKAAGDDVGRSVKKGATEASDGVRTAKENIGANAKEIGASFDGSVEGLAGGIQGLIAELTEGFGPAGLAAGVIAAAGVGLVTSAITQGQADTEAWKERIAELGQEFIETGGVGEASVEGITERLKELATATDDVNLADLAETARRAKGDFRDLAQAYAGNSDGLDDMLKKQEDLADALEDEQLALDLTTNAGIRRNQQIADQLVGLDDQINYLRQAKDANDQAAEAEANYLASGGPEMQAKADLIAGIDQAYDDAAGAVDDYIAEESGLFDVQAYIDAMASRSQALRDYQTDILSSGLTPEAIAFLNEQGVESAAQMLAGYKSAAPDQKASLNSIWSEAGRENSGEYKKALDQALPKEVKGPRIVAEADVRQAAKDFETLARQRKTIDLTVRYVDSRGKPVLQ